MGRRVDAGQLVGATEIGQRLGVRRQLVNEWRRRYPDFPDPVVRLTGVNVWVWPDVEDWLRRTGRLR